MNLLALGFPMTEHCSSYFFAAVIEHLDIPAGTPRHCEIGSIPSDARNKLVRWFLSDTEANYLVMIDSDHRLPRNLLERIAGYEDPVVGAFYNGRHEPYMPIALVPNPRWQDRTTGDPEYVNLWNDPAMWAGDWRPWSLVPIWPSLEKEWTTEGKINRVLVVGGGCLAIRRDVLEDWPDGVPWFDFGHLPETGDPVGEDVWFCREVARHGHGVYVDCGVVIPHMTMREIGQTERWGYLNRRAMEMGIPV